MYSQMDDPPVREGDTDQRLKSIRDRYEERLVGMTERLRAIVDDLKQDEVIATMKEDPASAPFAKARMRELIEHHFSNEREETIEKLIRELANLQAENQRLSRENTQVKSSMRGLEEQIRTERSKVENTEREYQELRSKTAVSGRHYEDSLRQLEEESSSKLSLAKSETEKLRELVEKSNRDLWVKTSEIDLLRQDLDNEKNRNSKLMSELTNLQRAYEDLENDYEKLGNSLKNSTGSSADLGQRLNRAMEEIEVLERTAKTYEKEKEELRSKYLSYSQEIRDALQSEQKSTSEAIESLRQSHKSKSSLFKKKILEQKSKLHSYEIENNELRSEINAMRVDCERSIALAQEDMMRIRDEWEAKCKSIEKSASEKVEEMQRKQQAKVAQMQSQMQTMAEEKVKNMQEEFSHQLAQHSLIEADLRRQLSEHSQTLDKDYIHSSKHETLLSEEITRLKSQLTSDKKNTEEELNAEFNRKMTILKADYEENAQKLALKIKQFEEKCDSSENQKRKIERELAFSTEKIESLMSKITNLNAEISELETNKRTMLRYVDEAGVNLAKLKALYEDEMTKRKTVEENLAGWKEKCRNLEGINAKNEAEFRDEVHNVRLKHLEEVQKLQETLEKEQNAGKKMSLEIQKLREMHDILHTEKKTLHENHKKTADEFRQQSLKLRQEGVNLYESEVAAHKETIAELENREQDILDLEKNIEKLQANLADLKAKNAILTDEKQNLLSEIQNFKGEFEISGSEKGNLQSKIIDLKRDFEAYKQKISTILRSFCQEKQEEMAEIRKIIVTELMEYKKFMLKVGTEVVNGLEKIEISMKRNYSVVLIAKEDQIKALEREILRREKGISEEYNSKIALYESKIDNLELSVTQLTNEIAEKQAETANFLEKITNLQLEESRLREENDSLQVELTTTMQDLTYIRMEKEESEVKLKTNFQEEVSLRETEIEEKYRRQLEQLEELVEDLRKSNESNMLHFSTEIEHLQSKHRDEISQIESQFSHSLEEMRKSMEIAQKRRYEIEEVVEETLVEVAELRAEGGRGIEIMQEEMGELLSVLHNEQEKMMVYRQEKTAEIEEFSRKLKLITRELQEKDESLEKSNHDRELFRAQLKEIRESQVKREIEDLRGSVERSLSATAKELRPTKKSDEDDIRPEKRKTPLSLTQLKASLDRFS